MLYATVTTFRTKNIECLYILTISDRRYPKSCFQITRDILYETYVKNMKFLVNQYTHQDKCIQPDAW